MGRLQKVVLGMLALSSLTLAGGFHVNKSNKYNFTDFAVYKVDRFNELRAVPGFSLGAPSGMVSRKHAGYVSVSGIKDKDDIDGGMILGMGYGDPNKIGGDISLSIGSVNPSDGGAFNRGALNLSVGHNFTDYLLGVSFGIDGINLWHDNDDDHDTNPSMYLSTTKLIPNDIAPMTFTVGVGNNNYAKVNETGDKKDKIYPFVSGAIYLMPQLSLIGDYTSKIATVGVSFVPFPRLPIAMSLGAYDITKERKEDKVSLIGTLSMAFYL